MLNQNVCLEINNLTIAAQDKIIIQNCNLKIRKGEIHLLMGPNGSGKSSLALFLAGHPRYSQSSGQVFYQGKDIANWPPTKRAWKGIFISFQNPQAIPGVSLSHLLRSSLNALRKSRKEKTVDVAGFYQIIKPILKQVSLSTLNLSRSFNDGFSGGERKKLELIQFLLLKPQLTIFDEIDSGLDIDALKAIFKAIKKNKEADQAIIFITHNPRVLKYLTPNLIHVLKDKTIVRSGGQELIKIIEEKGFRSL